MTKNPTLNAIAAAIYIVIVVSIMQFASRLHQPDSVIIPMTILSMFTLSAAVMGYLFLGNPIQLYLDGKKKEAVTFFFRTVGTFAVITVLFLLVLFSGLLS